MANDFTAHLRMNHSCMWTEGGEKRAQKLAEEAQRFSAQERAKAIKAFRPLAETNFTPESVVKTDRTRAKERRAVVIEGGED